MYLLLFAAPVAATAGINSQLSFEGKVVNSDGTNVTNGTYNLEFKIYQDGTNTGSGSTLEWTEDYLVAGSTGMPSTGGVTVTNGTFQVNLASICAFSAGTCGAKTNAGVDFNQQTLWLSMQVGNTSACTVTSSTTSFNTSCGGDGEMTPFIRLTATPYSLNSNAVGGFSASQLGQLATNQTWTGTNSFQPSSNSAAALLVRNTNSQSVLGVDTLNGTDSAANNLANNPSVEVAPSASDWVLKGTATVAQDVTQGDFGAASVKITGAATNDGAFDKLNTTLTASTAYNLTFYVKSNNTTTATIQAGYSINASAESVLCTNTTVVTISGWTRYNCSFTTPASGETSSNALFIKTTDATGRTINVDGAYVTTASAANTNYTEGQVNIQGSVSSALILENTTNSSSAFSVQNAAGGTVFNVDTTDNNLLNNPANPGFETNTTGWTVRFGGGTATATILRDTSQQAFGLASLKVTSAAQSGDGARYTLSSGSWPAGTYTVSFSMLNSGTAFAAVPTVLFGNGGDNACAAVTPSSLPSTSGWTRYSSVCTFSGTTTSIVIAQNEATAHTFYIDSVQLETGSLASAYGLGALSISGPINTPLQLKNQSNSTVAFNVQNSAGNTIFAVDTTNSAIQLGNTTNTNTVGIKAGATSSSYTWTLPTADSTGCLQSNGSGTLSISACGDTHVDIITSTQTWSKPTNALIDIVEAWGAGGGGGGGQGGTTAAARTGGGGGGGGSYTVSQFQNAQLSTTVVTIGAVGSAGTAGNGAAGGNGGVGGNTCFSTVTACAGTVYLLSGGGGGGAGTGTAGNGGGGGGGDGGPGGVGSTVNGGVGGGAAGAVNLSSSGFAGAGGANSGVGTINGNLSEYGGAGGGTSTTTGANPSGAGGSSVMGAGAGGGGGSCATACVTFRAGGAGGTTDSQTAGGGGTAGTTTGQAGGNGAAACAGAVLGGNGGGGGAATLTNGATGGTGGNGSSGGGGGGGGGGSEGSGTQIGGAGGTGGVGCVRITTLRGTGADLAETYCNNDTTIKAGDTVSIDSSFQAGVKKSQKAYDANTIGIISTSPGLVTGVLQDKCSNPVLVALSGRVPTKVSLENGPIKIGDYLTASSTPGVAMKATKAGQVIGQALTAYNDPSLPAYVITFVENGRFNGAALSEVLPASTDPNQSVEQQALNYFMSWKDQAVQQTNLSEILADRVSASLEIITPSVVADKVATNTITPSSTGNVTIALANGNRLIFTNKDNKESFSMDDAGNAQFGLNLSVLGNMLAKGDLSVDGNSLFNGTATFNKMAQFLGDTNFTGNVNTQGRVTFNSDTGGVAILKQGASRVDVTFAKPYVQNPIISASLSAEQVTLPDGTNEDIRLKEQRLFDAGYTYLISSVTTKGFTIVLNKPATENIQFNWTSIAVQDARTTTASPNPSGGNDTSVTTGP